MKSTITTAIEILNKVNTWANSSYAHLCNREGYPRGYREGIAFGHETIAEILGDGINDLVALLATLADAETELQNLREENDILNVDNKNLEETCDTARRAANRANIEINKLQSEKRALRKMESIVRRGKYPKPIEINE